MVSCEECKYYEQKGNGEYDCVNLREGRVHFTGDMIHTAECCDDLGVFKKRTKGKKEE